MAPKECELKAAALAKAQASSSLDNIMLTLISNVAIAISLSLVLYFEDPDTLILRWLSAAVAFALFRAWWVWRIKASGLVDTDPRRLLRTLTVLAFASGLLWSVVPLALDAFSNKQNINFIAFIMAGTTTGAIIQSLAYSPISIAFGAPLMGATLYRMIISGSGSGYVIAADAVFLTLMLFRAAKLSERGFIARQNKAFEAIDLANSLATANRELERLALTDPLTELANRSHFRSFAEAACRSGAGVAFVLLDIDRFKTINDTRGHDAGDRVIRMVADTLRSLCQDHELPVRVGGDEFVVVLEGEGAADRAVVLAGLITDALNAPLTVAGHSLAVSCSIGIAADTSGNVSMSDLLARADAALYRAKDDGRSCTRIFDTHMHGELMLQRCIDRDLPEALRRGELHVEFQPQVMMATREVIGFEALLRWKHPERGLIPPPDIVNAAIRLRLLAQLTRFVAERGCALLVAIDRRQLGPVTIAINVSPREFSVHSPARMLRDLSAQYGVDPGRIEIEITEEALFDPKHCASELRAAKQYGFSLAIDDFGVGHSSISNLMTVELDTIKIDRSFIHDITQNRQNQQLVAAITAVSLPRGYRIIAEGVETEQEAQLLRMLGCSYGQGWLFGRPMRESEAIAWLAQNGRNDAGRVASSI